MIPIDKPIIGITMGDPASIGPEIAVKALLKPETYDICHPILVGDAGVFADISKRLGLNAIINPVKRVGDAQFQVGVIDVYDLNNVDLETLRFGEISATMVTPGMSLKVSRIAAKRGARNSMLS